MQKCVDCGAPAEIYVAGEPLCLRCSDQRDRQQSQREDPQKKPAEPKKEQFFAFA